VPSSATSTQADPRSSYGFGGVGSASVSTTVAALEDAYTDADLFENICQIRSDELDGTGTPKLVHQVRGEATPDE
jgi:hypothetical protein